MISLGEIAARIGATCIGDANMLVNRLAPIALAQKHDVTWAIHGREVRSLVATAATAAIVTTDYAALHADSFDFVAFALLAADDAQAALARLLHLLPTVTTSTWDAHFSDTQTAYIDPSAHIDETARIHPRALIGARSVVGPYAVIKENVVVGQDCILDAGVVLQPYTHVGDHVRIAPHTVIGNAGFWFFTDETGRTQRLPHFGGVRIGDFCDVGSHVCIDAGLASPTQIEAGCKIDNLVQIGHGVVIGEDSYVVAQSGIAGESTVGENCTLGGQVGIKDYVHIGDNVRISAQAGVQNDIPSDVIMSGSPAILHQEWLKQQARIRREIRKNSKNRS